MASPDKRGPPTSLILAQARTTPGLSTPAAVNCLVSPSGPVLGCEPGRAEPDVAQNPALTQASPGRGPKQSQQMGPLGPSAPPGPFLGLPWKGGGVGGDRGIQF